MADNSIPEKCIDLFQKRAFAHLATLMPDGSPQVTPVWVDYDGNNEYPNRRPGEVRLIFKIKPENF